MTKKKITYIDLFAGIGGFHVAFHNLGAECVFASEWDASARKTYETNFKEISPALFENDNFKGDITQVDVSSIPDFNILCGGFPCQPFSQSGRKRGFGEARGTLFFDVARILAEKQPEAFFLENVRGLNTHDAGRTIAEIERIITEVLGYSFYPKVVRASDFGLPQHRPRLFMVGFKDKSIDFKFPDPIPLKKTMSDIFDGYVEDPIGFTLRVGGRGSGIHDRRNWDSYLVDGKVKRLTSQEGKMMQGFPDDFIFPVSESQAMKQLGNAVAVPAIQATAKEIINALIRPSELSGR